MKLEALKVGELARRTGLTVRTLHHYDEIGLLSSGLIYSRLEVSKDPLDVVDLHRDVRRRVGTEERGLLPESFEPLPVDRD
jgi:hypothetical protein